MYSFKWHSNSWWSLTLVRTFKLVQLHICNLSERWEKHDFLFIAGFCSNLNNSLSSPFSRDNCQWMWNVGLETNVGLGMDGLQYFIWCISRKHQNLNSCTCVSLRCPGELYAGPMQAVGIKQGRGAGWQHQGHQHAVCIWLPRAFTLTVQRAWTGLLVQATPLGYWVGHCLRAQRGTHGNLHSSGDSL